MTLDEIRALMDGMSYDSNDQTVIAAGTLVGSGVSYRIHQEWNPVCANQCDKLWGGFNIALLRYIRDTSSSESELDEKFGKLHLEDQHWDWFWKSSVANNDSYRWFFLIAEDQPQGACLIYHPKESCIDKKGIFYIEYLAVAPWNRNNPMAPKRHSGVGTLLIKSASDYARNTLGLRAGFSLHSLPKASDYYTKIGMCNFSHLDKDVLKYFEMCESEAIQFIGRE